MRHDHTYVERANALPLTAGRPVRIGIGGPVGSGKTALVAVLCRTLSTELQLAVVTNDIYTSEDDGTASTGRARGAHHRAPDVLALRHRLTTTLAELDAARTAGPWCYTDGRDGTDPPTG